MKSTSFLFALILTFASNAQICLEAHYSLNGHADDSSGNAHHGTINGATITADRDGVANGAYLFDGINDYIEFPNDFDFVERSFIVGFRADKITSAIANFYNTDHPGLNFGLTSLNTIEIAGIKYLRFNTGGTVLVYHDEPIIENEWYEAATVVAPDSVRYYLDCHLVATKAIATVSSSGGNVNTRIGCGRFIHNFFEGAIDDVKVYNCALDSIQICDTMSVVTSIEHDTQEAIDVKLYPNPVINNLTVKTSLPFYRLEILTMHGQVVESSFHSQNARLNLEGLEKGMYLLRLITDREQKTFPLIKSE